MWTILVAWGSLSFLILQAYVFSWVRESFSHCSFEGFWPILSPLLGIQRYKDRFSRSQVLVFLLSMVQTGTKIPTCSVGVSRPVAEPSQQGFTSFSTFQFNVKFSADSFWKVICVSLVRLFLYFGFDTTAHWSILLSSVLDSLDGINLGSTQCSFESADSHPHSDATITVPGAASHFWLPPGYPYVVIKNGVLRSLPF